MTTTAKRLFTPQQLTAALVTYYTAPALTRTILKKMTLTNADDAVAYTVNIHLVPAGGSADDTNIVLNDVTIAPSQTLEVFEVQGHVMNAGDFLQAEASTTAKISIAASGIEIT